MRHQALPFTPPPPPHTHTHTHSGRKRASLLYVATYAASCATKHSSNYSWLLLGRLLGGVSTSLLFSVFEAWAVAAHTGRGFDEHLLVSGCVMCVHSGCVVWVQMQVQRQRLGVHSTVCVQAVARDCTEGAAAMGTCW